MSGFEATGVLSGEEARPGDDRVIRTSGRWETSVTFTLAEVNPAIWWLLGVVRVDLLHDACGVNGEYQPVECEECGTDLDHALQGEADSDPTPPGY